VLASAAAVVAIILVVVLTRSLPGAAEIRALADSSRVTTLFDAADRPIFTVYKEERIEVPLTRVSPQLIHAVIAVEDERFYHHTGIDILRIGAALAADIRRGDKSQGGSTITQQLARRMFLDDHKTLWRKSREAALAFRIEREFSKDKILELYLNNVYFGHGFYGVEAAARGYFGKSARELGVDEAALLAGLIQAPSAYAPQAHPERALARREIVLSRMVDAGFLDRATADRVARMPIRLHESPPEDQFGLYFKNYVTRQLVQQFGEELVYDGGLRVFTTIDASVQRAAEAALAAGLAQIEQRRGYKHPRPGARNASATAPSTSTTPYLQGALVALVPQTGAIRALVGGRDFDDSTFDRATQAKRQAGSAFKPFIYAAALESGFTPSTMLTDLDPVASPDTAWMPDEAHGSATSEMTVRTALRTSSNRAAVRILRDVGIGRAVTYAQRFGLEAPPAVPSIALGTSDVSVLQMTAAYAAFANGGQVPQPNAIRRVEDRAGRVLFEDRPSSMAAIGQATAFMTAQILADVVNAGTGYQVRKAGFTLPAGGKTGTTDDFRDAWFAGFTPALAATVWVGFDQPQRILANGFAGDLAAPIWGRFMKQATGNRNGQWLTQPPDVVAVKVCRMSGLLASPGCQSVLVSDEDGNLTPKSFVGTEYFRRGTEPREFCTLHEEWESGIGREHHE
jgi:penicillin-binding protein 1A